MQRRSRVPNSIVVFGIVAAATVATSLTHAQSQPPPRARYAMDVETLSGMAGMAGRGVGGAFSMAFGGGGKETRMLHLRLGSSLAATGVPKADHFFLPAAKLGKSVPLISPDKVEGEWPEGMERPKGRLLLYWGCSAVAGKGQPIVIDFAKIAAGQMPPNLFSVRVPRDPGPLASNSKSFAQWPYGKNSKQPGGGSSLLGEHRIASTFAPEIKFSLGQEYMQGLRTETSLGTSGAVAISWAAINGATGYHAWTFGMKMGADGKPQDMVWWSSASAREFGGGLWDWLSPAVVQRLIGQKIVMPPSQTSCIVPAEVKAASPEFMLGNIVAYGPEANFAFPPRPADSRTPWIPDWTAKIRYRAMTSWMVGAPGMPGADGGSSQPQEKKCKPSLGGLMRGKAC
ncbi:MAG: hypothetical protein RIS52_1546 [Pseudomonadota bacterium]